MKKVFPLLLLGFILASCAPEEQITNDELITFPIDSNTTKEHNLVWNNRYYQLDFDTAYASTGNTSGQGIGCGPATIIFKSCFKDRYSENTFAYYVVAGYSDHGDTNFQYYVTNEVQERIDSLDHFIPMLSGNGVPLHAFGSKLCFNSIYNNITNDVPFNQTSIELVHFHTYFSGTDKIADYQIKITSANLEADLQGQFRAQDGTL